MSGDGPLALIESVIDMLSGRLAPSAPENLLGFVVDVEHILPRHGFVEPRLRVAGKAEPRCMLEVDVAPPPDVEHIQALTSRLYAAWDALGYLALQARGVGWFREALVLRFASASPPELFVTGRIVVLGGRYPELAADYGRRFHPLPPREGSAGA